MLELGAVAVGESASAPVQNDFPITAAFCTSCFCSGSSRSSRAAISPCTVSGSRSIAPCSRSMRANSSAYSGLPPARARSSAWVSAGSTERLEELADQARGVFVAQRHRRDRERVLLAAAPAGASREELRARGAHDEERDGRRPVDQVVDEVEQALVGPVEVLEDEHERPLVGETLEEPPPRGESLVPAIAAAEVRAGEADQRSQVGDDPRVVGDRASLRSTSCSSSSSRMPACALTISPRAQKVMPSP